MTEFYRVEEDVSHPFCEHCGHGKYWTIISGNGDDVCECGTSWGDKEHAEDICELMNMAYEEGQESSTANAEETKLVEFFRSPEGDQLGRAGDHDNLSPAETAIRAMLRPYPGDGVREAYKALKRRDRATGSKHG